MLKIDEHNLHEYNNIIAENIWRCLRKEGITPNQLARRAGVSDKRLYALLKPYSTANVTSLTIIKIETYFGLKKGELFKCND